MKKVQCSSAEASKNLPDVKRKNLWRFFFGLSCWDTTSISLVNVMIEFAINLIVEVRKKFEEIAALQKEVGAFVKSIQQLQPILEQMGEQQTAKIKDNMALQLAFRNLQSSIQDGKNVLEQCVSESRNRRLTWQAQMFGRDSRQKLVDATQSIDQNIQRFTAAGVFSVQKKLVRIEDKLDTLPTRIANEVQHLFANKEEFSPREIIRKCKTMGELLVIYDTPFYKSALERLRRAKAQSGARVEDFAKDWAIRMRMEPPEDVALNEDRAVALQLIYQLCDLWKDPNIPSVTQQSIVETFKASRIQNILSIALCMDRAQALYKMQYPGSDDYGMHWLSKSHMNADPFLKAVVISAGGQTTMNKRLVWLLELEELQLHYSQSIQSWLKPAMAPYFSG